MSEKKADINDAARLDTAAYGGCRTSIEKRIKIKLKKKIKTNDESQELHKVTKRMPLSCKLIPN